VYLRYQNREVGGVRTMVRDIARSRVGCKADVLATDQKIERVANFCVMAVPGHLDPGILTRGSARPPTTVFCCEQQRQSWMTGATPVMARNATT